MSDNAIGKTGDPAPDDIFTDSRRWGDMADWNRVALALHGKAGIHRLERAGYGPFWAIIDHAAVLEVEKRPELFTNAPEPILETESDIAQRDFVMNTLIHMDAPQHGKYRQLTNDWFKASSIRQLDAQLDELCRAAVSKLESLGGRCDFVAEVALPFPLQVILKLLGLPEEDYPRILMLTQQLLGEQDPDLRRAESTPEVQAEVVGDFYAYFAELTAARRENPTSDLATLIANGLIDGEPMPEIETFGYYLIVATAGHDTTASAIAGGLQALVENPDQLDRLKADPERLMPNAVEEMLRWTSPVRHFMRTAQADTEVCGQKIRKGDWLYLSYKGANLDPKVFRNPLEFDIARENAREHLAFGYGVHYCLGAQLARTELRKLFGHLVPRIESIEFDAEPTTSQATMVGGTKTLPIRYSLTAG